jgi:outer membrane receptor protein involved in Fe transport
MNLTFDGLALGGQSAMNGDGPRQREGRTIPQGEFSMKKNSLLTTSAIGTAAFMGLLAATPAFAEDTATAAAQDNNGQPTCTPQQAEAGACTPTTNANGQTSENQGGIVVTGSRIRRPNLESNVPITSVTAEDLTSRGDVNVGEALNDLPSLRSTFSQSNSVRFIGTTGLNQLDLRGLGTNRTLVLVNGRRHVTATPGDYDVDVNTIPTDLIERVDVITGGSSAVYGSDAVAGVVNFVLKRDFDGVRLRGQGGVSQQGDRGIEFVSLTAGHNFLDDRANIAINLEYVNAEPLYFAQRPLLTGAFNGRCQFNGSSFSTSEPQSGNGVPDQQFYCGVRNGTISNGGTVLAATPAVGGVALTGGCTNATLAPGGANAALGAQRCLNPGTAQGQLRIFRFDGQGNLLQDIPALDFRPFGSGNILDDPNSLVPGATLRNTGQIAPGLDRYTANVLMHIDISDAFRPFAEMKYVHLFSRQEGQPSFYSSIVNTIGLPNLRCNNAFLTAANLATLQSIGLCANPATNTISLNRFNVDFGGRSETVTRDTYRGVVGVQGDFNDDWNYEVSFTYGHVDIHANEINDLLLADQNGNLTGFSLAYDAVLNGAGQVVCRVNQVTVTVPACVPINMFGNGRPSQAALNFVNTTSFVDQRATQMDALAYINGDLSQLFSLPGGPIRFVVGAEWRRETAHLQADPVSAAGGTFFNAFSTFAPPAMEVKEAFGELEIPLLRDLPFAQELTLTGAARYSDYNRGAGTVGHTFAYNINGTWAPIRDIRFRANYSKSVRVPTLGDLFTNPTQNFAQIGDPCDILNIGNGTTNRPTNCAAAGIPAGFVNTPARTASTGYLSQGNPFLSEETGKSLTIGGVLTPHWIPGLSFTADYYRIRVTNLIAVLGPQTILNQCFDLPQPNQYCALLNPRNPDFTFRNPALISGGVNFAQFKADGIDFELDYRHTFGNGHRLDLRGIATYVIRRTNYTSPTSPTFGDRILGELGDPQWAANLTVNYGIGGWDLRWSVNYIGRQTIGAYENYFSFQGRPPQNADLTAEVWYPAVMYHNVRLSYRVNQHFLFYGGADNVFDREPLILRNTFGSTGTAGGAAWDYIGRYFYAGATVDF